MTSNNEAFVWIWLPEITEPVVAGKLVQEGEQVIFNYGKGYLERKDAIAIYDKELPLKAGALPPLKGLQMPSCIRDASPDAWGRRVIINKVLGYGGMRELSELTYLLESGSDRIGALDFQYSAKNYEPRNPISATLDELLDSAERVEKGLPLTPELDLALEHGTSIGGARPKALIEDKNKKYVAKFSSSTDLYSVVKAEYIAMRLARLVGLHVAEVSLVQASKRDVLLIERFDRSYTKQGWERHMILSALTLFGLDEMMARYASYVDLSEIFRFRCPEPASTLKELFSRIIFNILVGNTDDHARNHAVFWNGESLALTPAYDICPQSRSGSEATQAMLIIGDDRRSQIATCLNSADNFLLTREDASDIVMKQLHILGQHWHTVCEEAQLSTVDRKLFWGRQFLNPYAFHGLEGSDAKLKTLADEIRADAG